MNKIYILITVLFVNIGFSKTYKCEEKQAPSSLSSMLGDKIYIEMDKYSDQDLFSFFFYEIIHASKSNKPLFFAEAILRHQDRKKLHEDKINLMKIMAHQARIGSKKPISLKKEAVCKVINKINNRKQ